MKSIYVSRSLKLAALGICISLSSGAGIAMAQQRAEVSRGASNDAVIVRERASAHKIAYTEGASVIAARIAGSREASPTSEELSGDAATEHHRVPMVSDWSTRQVVFGKPRTEKDAARLEHNARYQMQLYRHSAPTSRKLVEAGGSEQGAGLLDRFRSRVQDPHAVPTEASALNRDWTVTLGGNGSTTPTRSVGASQFPAKFSFDINATPSCADDFVVYNTNTPLLIAFNDLYTGKNALGVANGFCAGLTGPSVMWAYNVATNGGVTSTSVTLSLDGTQVAFVESSASGSILHILKWSTEDRGTVTAPATPANATGNLAMWATCGGTNHGCMWNVPFAKDTYENYSAPKHTFATDSYSSPYYDYDTDILFVGTDDANVHKFVNIFEGLGASPTVGTSESGGLWPIYMDTNANPQLTGPIEDSYSGRIFVSTYEGALKYIETASGTCISGAAGPYPCEGKNQYTAGTYAFPDAPVVDSSMGTVMVFQGIDGYAGTAAGETPNPYYLHAYAAQAPTTSCICGPDGISGGAFVFADFGLVTEGSRVMHNGDFDNNYYSGTGTGYMYICAIEPNGNRTLDTGGNIALRRMSFGSDGLISGLEPNYLQISTTSTDECSPVTEVYNPSGNAGAGQDLMFFSVETNSTACKLPLGSPTVYSTVAPEGGCLMSVDVTADSTPVVAPATAPPFPTVYAATLAESGGTSGIVVDNISPDAQASSVYFTALGWTVGGTENYGACTDIGCASKATQNGLN
jgi:hypothetical protein